jgi:hypothetical protein
MRYFITQYSAITDAEVRTHVNDDVYTKYVRYQRTQKVVLDPNARWCP